MKLFIKLDKQEVIKKHQQRNANIVLFVLKTKKPTQ